MVHNSQQTRPESTVPEAGNAFWGASDRWHVEHTACRFIMTNVLPAGRNGAAHDALCVEVLKTSAGLGLSLDGGKSSVSGDGPLLIKRVYKGKVYLHGNPSLLCEDRTASKACDAFCNNELYCACIKTPKARVGAEVSIIIRYASKSTEYQPRIQ